MALHDVHGRYFRYMATGIILLGGGFSAEGAHSSLQNQSSRVVEAVGDTAFQWVGQGDARFSVKSDEIIIDLKKRGDRKGAHQLARALGAEVLEVGEFSGLIRLKKPADLPLERFLARAKGHPLTQSASYNAVVDGNVCETGFYDAYAWHKQRAGYGQMCHQYSPTTLDEIQVAVLDTGVAFEHHSDERGTYALHPDLAEVPFGVGHDFVNGDAHANDDHGHGTHIAAIVASSGKVTGIAPRVGITPVKVLDEYRRGTEFELVEGMLYAVDAGAQVINMSLSFGLGYFPSAHLQEAVDTAASAGVLMVASAGNHGARGVAYPAAFPDVIAVGATTIEQGPDGSMEDLSAHYSNRGGALDLVAPGGDIGWDVNLDGWPDGILSASIDPDDDNRPGYWFMAGTSQSAAQVSGVVAWLLAMGEEAKDLRHTLLATADDLGELGVDLDYGAGQVNAVMASKAADEQWELTAIPEYYVSVLSYIKKMPGQGAAADERQVVVEVQVIDDHGTPVKGVYVSGSFYGSTTELSLMRQTDAAGVAQFISSSMPAEQGGIAVGFQVEGVAKQKDPMPSRSLGFYTLTPALAEALCSAIESVRFDNAIMLFEIDPDSEFHENIGAKNDNVVRSLMAQSVGTGLRSGPMTIVFDEAFAPTLFAGKMGDAEVVELKFDAALGSGWGPITSYKGRSVETVEPNLGSMQTYLILPYDSASATFDLSVGYPVITAPQADYLSVNQTFGDRFAQESLSAGFATSALGAGFASSSLGDGFATSTLGAGFATSTLGAGFATSTLGAGFASSTFGAGFASSALGAGFATSTLGHSHRAHLVSGASGSEEDVDMAVPFEEDEAFEEED